MPLGCTAAYVQVTEVAKDGDREGAIRLGIRQIRELAEGDPDLPPLRRTVAGLAFQMAADEGTPAAHQAFRQTVRTWEEAVEFSERSLAMESVVFYENLVSSGGDVHSHRSFRSTYPDSQRREASLREEFRLAWSGAQEQNTRESYEKFRHGYDGWLGWSEVFPQAMNLEAKAAFKEASAVGTVAMLRAFREAYTASPWAQEAHQQEALVAHTESLGSESPGYVAQVRDAYATVLTPQQKAASRIAEVTLAFAAVERSGTIEHGSSFLERYGDWEVAFSATARVRMMVLKVGYDQATATYTASAFEHFLELYGLWPEAEPYRDAVRDQIEQLGRAESLESIRQAGKPMTADADIIEQMLSSLTEHLDPSTEADFDGEYGLGETQAQREAREKAFAKAARRVKRRWHGKRISLQGGIIQDVEPLTEITSKGRARLKMALRQLRRTQEGRLLSRMLKKSGGESVLALMAAPYLMGCEGCMRDTGRFKVAMELAGYREQDYDYDTRGRWLVNLTVIYRRRAEALALSKGDVVPIKGKIQALAITENELQLTIQ
jgi:hypothetical protein